MIGIDEVGRGPWAGPVVAAAARLHGSVEGLNDSKKLTEAKRIQLSEAIKLAADIGIGWVSVMELDKNGLTWAVDEAMRRAIAQIGALPDERIVIDGNVRYLAEYSSVETIVAADGSIPAVSAASIVAKVARDNYMAELDQLHPGYEFAKHKGYGTALHKQKLDMLGPSVCHRMSFKPIKAYL